MAPHYIASIILLVGLGVTASFTDLTTGKVLNRHLLMFFGLGVLFDVVMLFLTRIPLGPWARATGVDALAGTILAVLLYAAGVWPAGDAKLYALFVFLVPPGLFDTPLSDFFWGFATLMNTFVLAYVFLVVETAWRWRSEHPHRGSGKMPRSGPVQRRDRALALGSRVVFAIATGLVLNTAAASILPRSFYARNTILAEFAVFVVLLLVLRRVSDARTYWGLAGIELAAAGVLSLTGAVHFQVAWPTMGMVAAIVLVLLARYLGSRFDVEEIPLDELSAGQILSPWSHVLVTSKLRAVRVSPNARLSEEDVERITSSKTLGALSGSIGVMRRMTFAPFIFAGVLLQVVRTVVYLH
jgi:hypothetical protein